MFSLRQVAALLLIALALICVLEARVMPYEADAYLPGGYRFDQWAENPIHKRVPSAGDMMVAFEMFPSSMPYSTMAPFDPTQTPHTHIHFNHYGYNPSLAQFYSTPVAPATSYYAPQSGGSDASYIKSESASEESPESNNRSTDPKTSPKYREKRARNNEAAKKSRLNRKVREKRLQEENQQLKAKVHELEQRLVMLQRALSQSNQNSSQAEYCSQELKPGSLCSQQPPANLPPQPVPFRETQNHLPSGGVYLNLSFHHAQPQ